MNHSGNQFIIEIMTFQIFILMSIQIEHSMTQTSYQGSLDACICTRIWINMIMKTIYPLPNKPLFYVSAVHVFKYTVGKGEIAHNEPFVWQGGYIGSVMS